MPAQTRVGDKSEIKEDSHTSVCCHHHCIGPGTQGSPNVNVNGQPALRLGDPGVHSHCCGNNKWQAIEGSGTVMINGKPAHRKGDHDQHCGGVGEMIEGSPNVNVGG